MDEITKVLIGTISGFIIAFFAEPVKNYISNRSKIKNLRRAIYQELNYNIFLLSEAFRESVDELKIGRKLFRFDTYEFLLKNEISIFSQMKEAVDIRNLFETLKLIVSDEKLDEDRKTLFMGALRNGVSTLINNGSINQKLFMDANNLSKADFDAMDLSKN